MKPGIVELHIEELVLDGFSPAERFRIGRAVEQELGRLFAERGLPPSLTREGEIPRLDGGTLEAKPGSGAEAMGARVAQAVYEGFNR